MCCCGLLVPLKCDRQHPPRQPAYISSVHFAAAGDPTERHPEDVPDDAAFVCLYGCSEVAGAYAAAARSAMALRLKHAHDGMAWWRQTARGDMWGPLRSLA